MGAWVTPHEGPVPSRAELDGWLRRQGLEPSWWSNEAGAAYAPHRHAYHKVLFCAEGSITFTIDAEDLFLTPGDRLDVEPGTEHTAAVGEDGVACVEAARQPRGGGT